MAREQCDMQRNSAPSWTLTEARHNFHALMCAALKGHQVVTKRGVPSYVFSPASLKERKESGAAVVVRALVNPKKRKGPNARSR
jgi:prevent-host-death family protein